MSTPSVCEESAEKNPPFSPRTKSPRDSLDAGGGGDASSDAESAGAVETKGARLVRELRQRAGAGSLALAPAAPCGGRPRQLDTALAQERVVLQTALANAVGFVDQARDELINWLDRRGTIPRSRPSINEIREIHELFADASSEDHLEEDTWSPHRTAFQEDQSDENTFPTYTRLDMFPKDSTSGQRDERFESHVTFNEDCEKDNNNNNNRNMDDEQGTPRKGNKSQTQKLRTLKKAEILSKREAAQVKWDSNLPRNRISNSTLHRELSMCEMNVKMRSIGFDNRFLKKKSLAEIYGSNETRKPIRRTTGEVATKSNCTGSRRTAPASAKTPRSLYHQSAKPTTSCITPTRKVRTITSGMKKMSIGVTRVVDSSSPYFEPFANRKKLGASTTVTSCRPVDAEIPSKSCKRQMRPA